jgi:shikimate dehydrogenase
MASFRFGLLGDPVAHSRSPAIHRALLAISGLDGDYTTLRSDRDGLASAIDDMRKGLWDGLNVTMPLKRDAAALADEVDFAALRSGSVNTLVPHDGSVSGHSTDTLAFQKLFSRPELATIEAIVVLGAGGGAAAALAAMSEGRAVYTSARRAGQAAALAARLGGDVVPWGVGIPGALVINATPIGMAGETLPAGVLRSAAAIIDLPYGTVATPAVAEAVAMGIPAVDGLEFLIRQAIGSFTMWTGAHVEFDDVLDTLRKT